MKSTTRVLKSALPLYREGAGPKAVLILHGYNGYPHDMYELAERLHSEGYAVAVPRLPGHGTDAEDFLSSGRRLWYRHMRDEYLNLQSRYDEVSVVGLSMGGVIAILLAAEFRPAKIVLLAPAVAVRKAIFYFTPILKFILPKIKRKKDGPAEYDEDRKVLQREYWSHYYSKTLAELNRLSSAAKKRLGMVECPVYIMVSEADRTVPPSAMDIISAGVSGRVTCVTLKKSPHVFFDGPEKDFVLDKVSDWLQE